MDLKGVHRFCATVAARRGRRRLLSAAALLTAAASMGGLLAQPPALTAPDPTVSTKQLMETTITEASSAIWNAFEPPTSDEQWTELEKASLALLDATKLNAAGGTGPMDKEWAAQPAWGAFNEVMLRAAEAALKAVRAKDHEALLAAGDQLYPPCEGCHLQFNPGVVEQN